MEIKKEVLDFFQKHLKYNDEEMEQFKNNERNMEVLARAPGLMNKTIVAEVVASKGCNSPHKVGDNFYFDGAGNLITKLNPKRVCIFALQPMSAQIFGLHELFYAGIDNPESAFNRTGCSDVGLQCGGWGNIVMEVRMEDREK